MPEWHIVNFNSQVVKVKVLATTKCSMMEYYQCKISHCGIIKFYLTSACARWQWAMLLYPGLQLSNVMQDHDFPNSPYDSSTYNLLTSKIRFWWWQPKRRLLYFGIASFLQYSVKKIIQMNRKCGHVNCLHSSQTKNWCSTGCFGRRVTSSLIKCAVISSSRGHDILIVW